MIASVAIVVAAMHRVHNESHWPTDVIGAVLIGASIVLSSVASTQLFGFEITPLFFCRSSLVVYAVFLYAERATCGGLFKPLSAA